MLMKLRNWHLSMKLAVGEGWLGDGNGLTGKIGLGNNRLADNVGLGLNSDISLLLKNWLHLLLDNIGLLNCNWLVDEVWLILILIWFNDCFRIVSSGFNILFLWLAGNRVSNNPQVFFSGSDNFWSVLNWNW